MFSFLIERLSRNWRTGLSVGVHLGALLILLHSGPAIRVRTYLPGIPRGARIDLAYLPRGASATVKETARKPAPVQPKSRHLPAPAPAAPSVSAETNPSDAASGPASGSSDDALGTDDLRIALTTYSPSPKPDLSHLPRGAQGEVVVDVTIDPTGQVADLQILQTLGYGVDGAVADTVRTWKFSPATKDGVPVASVQELHFHYGPV